MVTKRTTSKGAPSGASGAPGTTMATSALHVLAANLRGADRSILFGAVAERIRSCMLDPAEAAFIASWFERLAAGDDPKKVFLGETRGRKKGSTGAKFVRGTEVRLPDHADLCWSMRRAMAQHEPDAVFAAVAKVYSATPEYVRDVWESVAPTLAPDPSLPRK